VEKQKEIASAALAARTHAGVVYESEDEAKRVKEDFASRTVNGTIYQSKKEADIARSQKHVGILLGVGILFLPYVFSFFTLRKGYSKKSRLLSFGWLLIMCLMTFSKK